ncbi:MAG: SPFH domain-containing protein [bacterium]
MATISKTVFLPWARHLRGESSEYILIYGGGQLRRSGPGLAFWFNPLSTAVAIVPREDIETTFMLRERSSDFQELSVQVTITYRVIDHAMAAERLNFSVSLRSGSWLEQPLDRLASFWLQRSLKSARDYISSMTVQQAVTQAPSAIADAIGEALSTDPELEAMGLGLVGVQVNSVLPSADVEKALQTPTREAIQQKADEAMFERRAIAVEKERAIKQNELDTEIELEKKNESLIRKKGENRRLEIEAENEAGRLTAEGDAQQVRIRAEGQAESKRITAQAENEAEAARVALYRDAPPSVATGMALMQFASKIRDIQHLNITPDMLASNLRQFLTEESGKPE